MPRFLLIPRDKHTDFADFSAEDMQKVIEQYVAWGRKAGDRGQLIDGNKLTDGDGRVLRGHGGKLSVTEGPFNATAEVVSGYWIIEANDYDDAVSLVEDHPHLQYGSSLEIRQVEMM
jgi:hypothetical protein